jgi:hypothetical protein
LLQKGTWKSTNKGLTDEQIRWVEGEDVPSLKKKDSVVKSQKAIKSQEKDEK